MPIINNLSAILAFVGFILAVIALVGALRGKHSAKGLSIAGVVLCVVSFAVVLITQSAYSNALDKAVSGSQPVAADNGNAAPAAEQAGDQSDANAGKDYSQLAVTLNSVANSLTKYDGTPVVCVTVTCVNSGSGNTSFNPYDWKGEDANGAQRINASTRIRLSLGADVSVTPSGGVLLCLPPARITRAGRAWRVPLTYAVSTRISKAATRMATTILATNDFLLMGCLSRSRGLRNQPTKHASMVSWGGPLAKLLYALRAGCADSG